MIIKHAVDAGDEVYAQAVGLHGILQSLDILSNRLIETVSLASITCGGSCCAVIVCSGGRIMRRTSAFRIRAIISNHGMQLQYQNAKAEVCVSTLL